jgi:membrane associated rhomboid family serine protease
VYRLNTYPLLHRDIFHFLLNTVTLIPLLERFESEHGTVVTFILFTGAFGLIPGGIYTVLELYIFRLNGAAIGASVWVFLLLANEAMKQYRINPYFNVLDYRIPTWTTPLIFIMVIAFLVPHTSFLGHLCGAATGYLWGSGYMRWLAPADWILRWIEGKLNLLGRIPHYVSVDQKTYGRYGVLPSTSSNGNGRVGSGMGTLAPTNGIPLGPVGSTQRLGP